MTTLKKIVYHKCQSSYEKHHQTFCLKLKDETEKAMEKGGVTPS